MTPVKADQHYDEVTPEELFQILARRLGDVSALAEPLRSAVADLAGDD